MRTYLRLLRYLRPHAGLLAASLALMVAFALVDGFSIVILIPFLQVLFGGPSEAPAAVPADAGLFARAEHFFKHDLWSWLSEPTALGTLSNVCLLILGIYFIKAVLGYFQQFLPQIVLEHTLKDLREEVFAHLQHLSFRWYQRTRAGQLLSIMGNDVNMLKDAISTGLYKASQYVLEATVTLLILVAISWRLTLVALAVLPPITWIVVTIAKKLRRVNRERLRKFGDVTSTLQENVAGIRVVKAFGAEGYERDRFGRDNQGYFHNIVRSKKYALMGTPLSELLLAGAVVLILWIGGRMILVSGSLSPETFFVFLVAALKLSSPIKYLSKLNEDVQPALAACDRIFGILDTEPEVKEAPHARRVDSFEDRIEYRDVSFAYEDESGPVLHEISFTVRKGEVLALVGPSGGGKSTIVDLLPRFYDPLGGQILFDGVDLRDLKLADLRSRLGIVTQEVILFHDSVAANIAYGTGPDRRRLEDAARAANAYEFIMELPRGFDTLVGERGVRLSGGQRQRLAIARAIYRNPPILIFDEATSALDTESEMLVQQAIAHLMENRTSIVIAHRLSTVLHADQIVVVEGGRVVERGTHAELMALEGRYSQLYELQFADLPA
ncbi:MAG TPA: ABC transporter transmembrane domain-containing protein [Gemmatimonadota bacterium]|nr:ABC transporter transmembrane domain-containing protein [Gemmatimonadota bacterium]